VLGGFGLDLSGGFNIGHQGEMDEQGVFPPQIAANLANGLDKGQPFDIADGPADFDDRNVDHAVELENRPFDFIGNVGDYLNGATQIFTPPFFHDHGVVDAPGGVVVDLCHHRIGVTFVVAHVQIGFRSIVGDEDFPVLEGVHGAGVDIYIRVEFLEGNGQAAAFKKSAERSGCKAFTKGREHSAGNKNKLSLFGRLSFHLNYPVRYGKNDMTSSGAMMVSVVGSVFRDDRQLVCEGGETSEFGDPDPYRSQRNKATVYKE